MKNKKIRRLLPKLFSIAFIPIMAYFTYHIIHTYQTNSSEESYDLSTLMKQTKSEKITGEKIQVEVQNGCGTKGLATLFTNFLRSYGYDVIDSKNATNFNFNNTIIKIHKTNKGNFVEEIIEILNLDSIYVEYDYDNTIFYDLTLIIGKDYSDLKSFDEISMHHNPF